MRHQIRQTSGTGRSYFDKDGIRRQETSYYVRVWCDCGWTGMTTVEEVSAMWADHSDGSQRAD